MQFLSNGKGRAAVVAGLAVLLSSSMQPLAGTPEADRKGNQMRASATTEVPAAEVFRALLPQDYAAVLTLEGAMDGTPIVLHRYQSGGDAEPDLGGEHASLVVERDSGRLKGFTRLYAGVSDGALPGEDASRNGALAFLRQQAPDLLKDYEVLWIDRHDEVVRIAGRDTTVSGTKVKFRNQDDGLYFWVILAADGSVMTFERDIHWITFPGRRGTEKWLHDTWLQEQGSLAGKEPEVRIASVVDDYFQGAFHGDRARLLETFDSDARIVGFFGDEPMDLGAEAFVDRVVSEPSQASQGAIMDKTILSMEVIGRIALVKARVRVGDHVFIDLLTLHRTAEGWRIRHKSFDVEPGSAA